MPVSHPEPAVSSARHRYAWLVLAAVCAAALLYADPVYRALQTLLDWAGPVIRAHPVAGVAIFVALSALSAVLAFFSSAALVPAAIVAWGPFASAALLWAGWWLGGTLAYGIGRALGRPLLRGRRIAQVVDSYRSRLAGRPGLGLVLLLQLALPSEVPGYLCGLLGVPLRTYALALAIAELPFAAGTVLLGDGLVRRNAPLLVAVAVLGGAAMLAAGALLRRRMRGTPPEA
jgi:uncharacterized membrane protein YdjX (TVP38/TMEM64 family)